MFSRLVAISGMLAAAPAAAPRSTPVAAVEIAFTTHAGEGASGVRRVTRDGCYQAESGGGTGGAQYVLTTDVGCHLAAEVEPVFVRLAAVAPDSLVRDGSATSAAPGGIAPRPSAPGDRKTRVVIVRPDGSRWVAANRAAADDILRAVSVLPEENQSSARPPEKEVGTGAQLVGVSATIEPGGKPRRIQGFLASDGRWWCTASVTDSRRAEPKLPAKSPVPIANPAKHLDRILAGTSPNAPHDPPADGGTGLDIPEVYVEVAWPGKRRGILHPKHLRAKVAEQFAEDMQALSRVCSGR